MDRPRLKCDQRGHGEEQDGLEDREEHAMRGSVERGAARSAGLGICLALLGLVILAGAASGASPRTSRVSVGHQGQADGPSDVPAVSRDGRYVAFYSFAPNLVRKDTNGTGDIFLRDRLRGRTTRVSIGSNGQADGDSGRPAISADGRFIAFNSEASNLVAMDTNGVVDVFVRDRVPGRTKRVSVGSQGQADGDSGWSGISADGRLVTFQSAATNLAPGDTNGVMDVFVRDLERGRTRRVSIGSQGQADGASMTPAISANGRFVVFTSEAGDLVPGDTNTAADIFIHDRRNGRTRRVSVGAQGQADGPSELPAVSANGRFVAFRSAATNLVDNDTNGVADIFVRDRKLGRTTRVSVGAKGEADGGSEMSAISADGRHVAFRSTATNLVSNDTNAAADIFVRDRAQRRTRRVTVGPVGQADGGSDEPDISADGRFVAFRSPATNLAPFDTNGQTDIFMRGPLR